MAWKFNPFTGKFDYYKESDPLTSGAIVAVLGYTPEPAIEAGTTAQYWRGDKSWQTLNQAAVAGLTTASSPTFYQLTLSTSGVIPILYGSTAANGDLTIHGTSSATRTSSHVMIQPTAGGTSIGATTPHTLNGVANTAVGLNILGVLEMKRAGTVSFTLTDTSQAADKKMFQFVNTAANFIIRRLTDDTLSATTYITLLDGGNLGLGASPTAKLDINSDILRLRTGKTPATAGATGNQGDICWDNSYIYVCIATNTWRRVAHATW